MGHVGQFLNVYLNTSVALSILEVGSWDRDDLVGGMRSMKHPRWSWFGVDIQDGSGVDLRLEDPYFLPFASKSFDVVLSTETLEHVDFFWLWFEQICRVAKSWVFIITPTEGPYHAFPRDNW